MSANQKKNCPWRACFLSNRDEMRKSYRGPSIDASCNISLYLAKDFLKWIKQKQELPMATAMFLNGSERNKQCYRWHSLDAFYEVSVHLAKRCQRRRFICEKFTDRPWSQVMTEAHTTSLGYIHYIPYIVHMLIPWNQTRIHNNHSYNVLFDYRQSKITKYILLFLVNTIKCQPYHGDQVYCWRKITVLPALVVIGKACIGK
jgi:hypothetical protein